MEFLTKKFCGNCSEKLGHFTNFEVKNLVIKWSSFMKPHGLKCVIRHQDGCEDAVVKGHQEVHLDVHQPACHGRLDPGHPALKNQNKRY
jgi:hypothetical protein